MNLIKSNFLFNSINKSTDDLKNKEFLLIKNSNCIQNFPNNRKYKDQVNIPEITEIILTSLLVIIIKKQTGKL